MNAIALEPPPKRLSFSEQNPMHQIAWDSTSLRALKNCPRYYEYSIIYGFVTRGESVHLRFGIEYGNAITTYHKFRAAGASNEQARLEAIRYALVHTWDETLNRPWTSDDLTKNRETLIRTVVWYLLQFENDPLDPVILASGEAATELSFRVGTEVFSNITDEEYVLCGYLDRLAQFQGQYWIVDQKTTKYQLDANYFHKYSPDCQVSQYTFAGNVISPKPIAGMIIDATQIGVTFSRFQRGQISRTKAQLEEWFRDSIYHIRLNEQYVLDNYWPMNDTACDKYGGCPFRVVCSTSPPFRKAQLDGLFYRRVWDPLVVREI